MNYSCAHWNGDPLESLESAQNRKVRNLLTKAQISSSHHVLDIGCGWGDLAIKAVQTTGCRVTGLTLSDKQKELADQRAKDAGVEDRVRILLCDYRHVSGPEQNGGFYDRVISVGMFEHVGPEYLDQYFETISRLLHPTHGLMVVDGITMTNMVCIRPASIQLPRKCSKRLSSSLTAPRDQIKCPDVYRPLHLPRWLPTNHPHAPQLPPPGL